VRGVVEKRNTIPVLANILIEPVSEHAISITGTDLDVWIHREVEVEDVVTVGAMCIPARDLFDLASALPDLPVTIKTEDGDWICIESGSAKFRMLGISREGFPEVPTFKATPITIPASLFKGFTDRTIFAITQEESRYTLSGSKFVMDNHGIRVITTDGHRLALARHTDIAANGYGPIDILIPRKTSAALSKLLTDVDGDIQIGVDENNVYFHADSWRVTSRLLFGQFPKYEMVLPKDNDKSAVIDRSLLGAAIRRVVLMADERSHAIELNFQRNQIAITASDGCEREARETIPCEYEGEETRIGLNAQFLQDFVNAVAGPRLVMEFKGSESQVELRPVANEMFDYTYIVMPMRLG
jgi:DNA polymerase-3 subunit beta